MTGPRRIATRRAGPALVYDSPRAPIDPRRTEHSRRRTTGCRPAKRSLRERVAKFEAIIAARSLRSRALPDRSEKCVSKQVARI